MDRREFNLWVDDFQLRQPSVHAWVEGLPDPVATRKTWFDIAFSGFSLDEALEVTKQVQAGTVELDGWQDLPKTFRQAVAENRLARLEHNRRAEPCDFGEYRITCLDCRDTGLVTCWSVDAMRRARRRLVDDTVKQAWTTCAVACHCSRGDRYGCHTTRRGRETISEDVPRYDAAKWIRLDVLDSEADMQRLLDWAETYQAPRRYDFGEYSAQR